MSNSPPRKGKISIGDNKRKTIEQKPEMKRSSSIPNESEYDGFIKMLRKDISSFLSSEYNPNWNKTTSFRNTENGVYLKQILDYCDGKKTKLVMLSLTIHPTNSNKKSNRIHVKAFEIINSCIKKVKLRIDNRINELQDGKLFRYNWHRNVLRNIGTKQIGYLEYNLFFEEDLFLKFELKNKKGFEDLNKLIQDQIFTQFNTVIKNIYL